MNNMENAGSRWLAEDVMNLLELKDANTSWQNTARILGRSENACMMRYGMIRFAHMLKDDMKRVNKLIVTGRLGKDVMCCNCEHYDSVVHFCKKFRSAVAEDRTLIICEGFIKIKKRKQ
jgi:hypothetical protein